MRANSLRPAGLALAISMALTTLPTVAAETSQHYDIAAGTLEQTLRQIARQSGRVIAADPKLLEGRHANAVHGDVNAESAVHQALAGSGLQLLITESGTISVFETSDSGAMQLNATSITGAGLGATTESTGSYTTGSTSTATRLPLTLRETPQTVTVVTRQKMDDFNLTTMDDVLKSTSGVAVQQDGLSYSGKYFTRGFELQTQYDGVSNPLGVTTFTGVPDSAIFDHVEVLQGSAGLLSGAGEPGGTVNMVRKLPTAEPQASVQIGAGSWDSKRLVGDLSGPLTENKAVRGRAVVVWQDADGFVDYVTERKESFYGVLEADLDDATTVSGKVQYQHSDGTEHFGVPTAPDGRHLDIPRSSFWATDWSKIEKESWVYSLGLQRQLSERWKLQANYDHVEADRHMYIGNFWYYRSPTRLALVNDQAQAKSDAIDIHASGQFDLLDREHELVVGTSLSRERTRQRTTFTYNTTDIYSFVPTATPRYNGVLGNWQDYDQIDQRGLYLTTRLSLADPLKLILGVRTSDYRQINRRGVTTQKESGVVTPYGGLVYDFGNGLSAYASYSDIFRPQSEKDKSGATIIPVVGSNYELGIKGEFYDARLNAGAALFRLEQENLATLDESVEYAEDNACGGYCYTASGTVVSQGVDLNLSGEVQPGWQMSAGYTYVDSHTVEGENKGDPYSTNLPDHILRVSTTYELPNTNWTIGADAQAQSRIYNKGTSQGIDYKIEQGTYALFGLMARYRISPQSDIGLTVKNLFDRTYYTTVGSTVFHNFYGEPRSFMATYNHRF